MSTTNIDEQKMQQISSSDTIKDFMEKCNNNFSIISKYGSGPEGKQGVEGSQGVPTKPKVPIHVWREGVEYYNETSSDDGYVINDLTVNLADSNYQEGHLIMLKNGHVYILKEDEESKLLKPNYIMALQSYNQDDVIDGKSAYIHIAYANSTEPDYIDFITNEELQKQEKENVGNGEIKYKYMGIYSDCNENPNKDKPYIYTWVRIVGDTGEKGDKGDKGDTPTSTSVEVVGYSLEDLNLDSEFWKSSISELGELKPGTPIYILNKYTWNDGTETLGKTVTMAGTQGIKGDTGRVLFYLGSFEDGTLTGDTVTGYLNDYRCDYYIDATGQAWMRTGTSESADGHKFGKDNDKDNWVPSEKVGFLQAGAISADMINTKSITANSALVTTLFAQDVTAENLKVNAANITGTLSAEHIKTGTISSNDGNSYFNLNTGDFVLGGNDNGAALKYENGTLTIGGVNDDSADSILNRLGLAESSISDALEAIADEEEERMQAIANIESIQESLQEQIDGEVTSWFLEGEPKNDNAPAKDWKTDELKQRHEGDTYTDITTFVSNETTPTAGQSWRWCNTDDEYGTGWHWHKIADNDATKALAEAAKAVAAADGKSKIFVVKPTNYQVGDLWILQSDTDHTAGKKGDILTANADSATYERNHWSKEIKYTDDTAIDNLEIGGRNILSNTETMEAWTPGGYNGSTIEKNNINDFYGKNATQIISNGGTKKYKVIYNLLDSANVDLNRQYTLSFNVKAVNYSLCICCKLSEEKGKDTLYSNEIIIPKDESRRVTFTGYPFGKDQNGNDQNLQLWFGAAYYKEDDEVASKYGANFYINELKLEYGNKATDWTPSTDEMDAKSLMYLKDALANDTDIAGGIIATSTIQLRDWTGNYLSDGKTKEYKVNSGLSGLDNDNVLMWGGGTYEEAANAALTDNDFHVGKDKTGRQITSLLKTDGTGKIGCFHIINDNTIAVKSSDDNSDIVISAGENEKDTNIIINQDGDMKVLISGDTIEKNSIYGVELKGTYKSNENITASNQDIVVKEIEVPPGTGNWSINFNAKKLMILFGIAPLSGIHRIRCSFDVYLCEKLIATSDGVWTNNEYLDNLSVSQEEGGVVNLKSFTSAQFTSGQKQTLVVKLSNVQVYRANNGVNEWCSNYNGLYLSSIRLCTKTGDGTNIETDYEDDSILLTYVSSRIGIIQIGRNGIQVSHKNGGFIQILNDDSELYVRMFGLPTYIPTGNNIDGNIYNWNGFLRIAGNESTSKKSTTIDLTEIGYKKVVLPSKVEIQNIPIKDGIYGQNELYRWGDGDIFINAYT